MKKVLQLVMALFLIAFTVRSGLAAAPYNNSNALQGVRETKVYFDVNVGEPAKLLNRLQLIDTTYDQLVAAGISPLFVVGIRGKASNYFTRDDDYVLDIDLPVKKQIEARVDQFKARRFSIEQCSIAAGLQDIDVADFLPQLEVVANGYISMIGYQSKGYAYVPMD
jgi:hypothetical protein